MAYFKTTCAEPGCGKEVYFMAPLPLVEPKFYCAVHDRASIKQGNPKTVFCETCPLVDPQFTTYCDGCPHNWPTYNELRPPAEE